MNLKMTLKWSRNYTFKIDPSIKRQQIEDIQLIKLSQPDKYTVRLATSIVEADILIDQESEYTTRDIIVKDPRSSDWGWDPSDMAYIRMDKPSFEAETGWVVVTLEWYNDDWGYPELEISVEYQTEEQHAFLDKVELTTISQVKVRSDFRKGRFYTEYQENYEPWNTRLLQYHTIEFEGSVNRDINIYEWTDTDGTLPKQEQDPIEGGSYVLYTYINRKAFYSTSTLYTDREDWWNLTYRPVTGSIGLDGMEVRN